VLAERLEESAVPVVPIEFGRGWNLRAAREIAALIRRDRIDLVDAQDSRDRKAAILAKLVFGARARLVITRRQMTSSHPLGNRLYGAVSDRVIAISHGVARSLVVRGLPADRISVVHTGLDPSRVAGLVAESEVAALRAELGLITGLPTVGVVARRKDQETLLVAAASLGRPLNIVFAGIERDAPLAALESELPAGTRVVYAGFRDDVRAFYALFDVKVLPTLREGLSQAILESLAVGVPVVAADAGGVPEVIEDGVNGLLFPAGDAAGLAERLRRILDDGPLRERLADAGRARLAEEFSADRLVEKTEKVYVELLG
jgi:glycosyltransferase involved in cell wall biosynthesis